MNRSAEAKPTAVAPRVQPPHDAAATSVAAAQPPRTVPPSHARIRFTAPTRRWTADSVLGLRWLR